jgi:hypothetical protein
MLSLHLQRKLIMEAPKKKEKKRKRKQAHGTSNWTTLASTSVGRVSTFEHTSWYGYHIL